MFEAEKFHVDSKRHLNASRHQRAIEHANAIEDELIPAESVRPDPGRLAMLVEILGTAMSSAPNGDAWTAVWARYCRWQARLVDDLSEAVAFLHERSGPDGVDQRYEVFELYYGDDPPPVRGCFRQSGDELVAYGLLRVSKSPNVAEWRTPLGRAVALHMKCDIGLDMEAILTTDVTEYVAFQQRIAADIRRLHPTTVAVAIKTIRGIDHGDPLLRYSMLAALAAAAYDPQLWDALCQVRQVVMVQEELDD